MVVDRTEFDDNESFIQTGILDFCGCGDVEGNLKFVQNGLKHIDDFHQKHSNRSFNDYYEQWIKNGLSIFGNESARNFFFYWADKEGFTEHGGSIPGWLTEKGRELLEDLNELY